MGDEGGEAGPGQKMWVPLARFDGYIFLPERLRPHVRGHRLLAHSALPAGLQRAELHVQPQEHHLRGQ